MRLTQLPVMAWIRNDLSLGGSRPKVSMALTTRWRPAESLAGNAPTTIFGFSTLSGALLLPDPLEHAVVSIMIATAAARPTLLSSGSGVSRSFVTANGRVSAAGGCGLGIVLRQQDVSRGPACRECRDHGRRPPLRLRTVRKGKHNAMIARWHRAVADSRIM